MEQTKYKTDPEYREKVLEQKREYYKKKKQLKDNQTSMIKYSKIELLALIKQHNRTNIDKIKNVDRLKKTEIYEICKAYSLIDNIFMEEYHFNPKTLTKDVILQDIEMDFIKKGEIFPTSFNKMKKAELIEYMELNDIKHYTPDMIKKEIQLYDNKTKIRNVLYYNVIRYGFQIQNINTYTNFTEFIESNKLDTNMEYFQEYSDLLKEMCHSYESFCKKTGKEYNEMKSIPEIIEELKKII